MRKKYVIIGAMILAVIGGYFYFKSKNGNQTPAYQTSQAEKGTLIVSVSASGNITSGNNINISTNASGTINQVFVKIGDKVSQGQKIANLTLDQDALQKQTQAWASYLTAKNQLATAQANINQLQAAEFQANQKFINDAAARGLTTDDPTYIQEWATWKQAEANYQNQSGQINQAQAAQTSAWYAYQQISSTITAPFSGIITSLTIAPGSLITGATSSSTNSTPQVIGTVARQQQTQALVSLSEIDAAKVQPGQKVTMTMDAFPNKTFTGKVLLINTNGQVSSGVTTYPATILFDTNEDNMYPNMGVNAKIITNIKDNVILVPTAAVLTANGENMVRILNSGQVSTVSVTTGDANDTQTEIVSGVNEGDTVITSVTSRSNNSGSSSSPFGGANRGFGGGGVIFRRGG
ncbi:efflux RND transporter periplasmic adaptor subunit [Patescibacteria group bacterium]|nr:efflux RND transporter periplasmic adaptor subunit [Patescibacteria group bacterium]